MRQMYYENHEEKGHLASSSEGNALLRGFVSRYEGRPTKEIRVGSICIRVLECYMERTVFLVLYLFLVLYNRLRLAGAGNFFLHHSVQNGSGIHPASYPMDTRGAFTEGKAAGT
jgi:hypothetical protein